MGSMVVENAIVYKFRKLKHMVTKLQDFFKHTQNFFRHNLAKVCNNYIIMLLNTLPNSSTNQHLSCIISK